MIGKTIDELKVGDTAEFTKTVSEADIPRTLTRSMLVIPFSRRELPTVCFWAALFQQFWGTDSPGMAPSI
jgi:hypothetical protein